MRTLPALRTSPTAKHVDRLMRGVLWIIALGFIAVLLIFVGAILWAWQMSSDMAAIKAEVRAQNELRGSELEDIRRRLARHDDLLDRMKGRE